MRPVEFAPGVIIQAGQELRAAGRNITGFALRQKIGGGNPGRLKQVWDDHLNTAATSKAEPVAELPIEVAAEMEAVTAALSKQLAALAVSLNDKSVKAADRRVHEVIRGAAEQREQAERELADAAQTVDDLETKLDEATAAAAAIQKRLDDAQAAQQAQAIALAQVRERLALAERVEAERDAARKEAADAREAAAALRGQVELLQAQVSKAKR